MTLQPIHSLACGCFIDSLGQRSPCARHQPPLPAPSSVAPERQETTWTPRDYHAEPQRQPVVAWLKAKGFIKDGSLLTYCWSDRLGMEHVSLEFFPLARHANDEGWDAIIGQHASGTNPRMAFGTCETLADVQMAYRTIRLLNGYGKPDDEPEVAPAPDPFAGLRTRLEDQASALDRASAACRAERGDAPVDVSGTPFECADCATNAISIALLREAAAALEPKETR